MYVCPTCKGSLEADSCSTCGFAVEWIGEVPVLFSHSTLSARYREIGRFYDGFYLTRENAWQDLAGRGEKFLSYTAALVKGLNPRRYLDIGCGQGFLLEAVTAHEKFGVDISRTAIEGAKRRTKAEYCLGIIEELPYPNGYFDVVTGIGVMEHFLDCPSALNEISRVLRKGGCFIVLLFLDIPFTERIRIKASEFIYPHFRPRDLLHWMLRKYFGISEHQHHKSSQEHIGQPVQNHYTPRDLKRLFRGSGLSIRSLITKRLEPNCPLEGHYFRFYILRKG